MIPKRKKPQSTCGGRRAGAGRKKSSDPVVTYSVDITHAQAELLKSWGGGNLSAGLRWLIEVSAVWVNKPGGG